jgi:hypothetical protein
MITQFRASAPRTYHSVGQQGASKQNNLDQQLLTNWSAKQTGSAGACPYLVWSRLSFKGAPLHGFGTPNWKNWTPHTRIKSGCACPPYRRFFGKVWTLLILNEMRDCKKYQPFFQRRGYLGVFRYF